MNLTEHFTLEELTKSAIVHKRNTDNIPTNDINNTPNQTVINNLTNLAIYVLEPTRKGINKPININCAYRCKQLNDIVKGASNSQHLFGEAADLDNNSIENNKEIFNYIKNNLEFDQLINESNFSWVHVSFRKGKNRKQVLAL